MKVKMPLLHLLEQKNIFILIYIGKENKFENFSYFNSFRAAVRDNKTNVLRTALQTRVDFPFEVDLWSLGVTLYQCATGL
jgi:hypothetical protein